MTTSRARHFDTAFVDAVVSDVLHRDLPPSSSFVAELLAHAVGRNETERAVGLLERAVVWGDDYAIAVLKKQPKNDATWAFIERSAPSLRNRYWREIPELVIAADPRTP